MSHACKLAAQEAEARRPNFEVNTDHRLCLRVKSQWDALVGKDATQPELNPENLQSGMESPSSHGCPLTPMGMLWHVHTSTINTIKKFTYIRSTLG